MIDLRGAPERRTVLAKSSVVNNPIGAFNLFTFVGGWSRVGTPADPEA
jgi:hypothetical protein